MRYGAGVESILFDQRLFDLPLLFALALGGGILVMGLLANALRAALPRRRLPTIEPLMRPSRQRESPLFSEPKTLPPSNL